eukprot:Pgem_evm1s1201
MMMNKLAFISTAFPMVLGGLVRRSDDYSHYVEIGDMTVSSYTIDSDKTVMAEGNTFKSVTVDNSKVTFDWEGDNKHTSVCGSFTDNLQVSAIDETAQILAAEYQDQGSHDDDEKGPYKCFIYITGTLVLEDTKINDTFTIDDFRLTYSYSDGYKVKSIWFGGSNCNGGSDHNGGEGDNYEIKCNAIMGSTNEAVTLKFTQTNNIDKFDVALDLYTIIA